VNRHLAAVVLVSLVACTTTQTRTVTWAAPPAERFGEVSWIRQTTVDQQGNPAGGAVVGALVGGLFGRALGGGRGPGTIVGAAGGAVAGAALSQGGTQEVSFDVGVRFDDGGGQVFRFPYQPFLTPGERVGVIGGSLRSLGQMSSNPPPGPPPQFVPPPPPPPPGGLWPPPPPS
jgi:outer membrane lipoprotein SlyB